HGKRVLLIDLDGQGNLTERCIPEQVARHSEEGGYFPSIAQYFAGDKTLVDLITASEDVPGLSLIPSDPFLTLRDLGGSGRPAVELQFVRDVQELCTRSIASLSGTPDWIVIDTPPSMSVFTRAGLAVAGYVLAPLRPRVASLAGTRNMLRTMRTMNALMGTNAVFLGGVITHMDKLVSSQFFVDVTLPNTFKGEGFGGGSVFDARIPLDNQLETLQPGARTGGAEAYGALAKEVLDHVNLNGNTTITSRTQSVAANVSD